MATLPVVEGGQMMLRGAQGGVPMAQVSVGQVEPLAARAAAQQGGTLAQILDRMSSSAFQEAGRLAQVEALQFAADNPITPAQIEIAKNGGSLDRGRAGSIFDEALRKARALELSSHFEMEGRNELKKILVDVDQGTITGEEASRKIATVTNGYNKALTAQDPEAALKFRATMSLHGNTVLNAAYEADAKRAKAQRIAKFDMDFDNGVRILEATVSQHPDRIDELADVFRRNVTMQAMILGDAGLQKEYSTKFETALRNAKINALTRHLQNDEYIANPEQTLTRIRAGDVGNMSPLLQQMIVNDFDAVAKVTANYMVAANQRETLANAERARVKREGQNNALMLLQAIFPLPEGDPTRNQLIGELTKLPEGSVPIGTLKDLLSPSQGESNAQVLFNVTQGIYNNTITQPDQIWQMVGKGLSAKDAVSSLRLLQSEDRRDQSELDRGISRLAGIPVIPGSVVVLDPKGEEFKRRSELQAQALDIQAQAARDGKVMTPRQILQQLETNLEQRRSTEEARAAQRLLQEDTSPYVKKAGGKITRDNLAALEKSGKLNPNEIRRIRQLLDQAEGIR